MIYLLRTIFLSNKTLALEAHMGYNLTQHIIHYSRSTASWRAPATRPFPH